VAAYKRRESVPRPKGNHEAHPGEEDAAMAVERIEQGDGPGLFGDGVELRRCPEG